MRKAVIDLGSNSFHLLVADVDGSSLQPVARKRVMLHLGHEVAMHGTLRPRVIERVVETAKTFVETAKKFDVEAVRIVATAAIRDATNRDLIVEAIAQATGVSVSVLSPDEEGKYAFHGVNSRNSTPVPKHTVIDLGGGSMEIITGQNAQDAIVSSVPIGVSRFMPRVTNDPLHADDIDAITTAVGSQLAAIDPEIMPGVTLIGGSIRALARMLDAAKQPHSTKALKKLCDTLVSKSAKQRLSVPGMRRRRVNHLHVAALIWCTVLTHYGIKTFTVSDSGLREGVLRETRRPQMRTLTHVYKRHVTADSVGSRVSIRHLVTDPDRGTIPTDIVGRLAAFDDDMALVIDRHGTLHIIDVTMILASKMIPAHPTRAAEPAVGTKDDPVVREAARAVIVTDNQLLLIAHHPEPGRTVWTAPGGGQINDETPRETVRREVTEELGVDVTVGDVLFERTASFAFRGVWLKQHETWLTAELNEPFLPQDAPLNDAGTSQVRAFHFDELISQRQLIAPEDLAERIKPLFTPESHPDGAP